MRVACVLVPQFPAAAELARRPELAGRPFVVGGLPHQRLPVLGCSPEAAAFGVAPGMPVRKAQGLCPEALFLPADDELYGRTRALLLRTLGQFSPRVETPGNQGPETRKTTKARGHGDKKGKSLSASASPWLPDPSLTIYLDASGLGMLFGPDRELGARIAAAAEEEAGLRPRVAIAGGKFVARAAALRTSPGGVVVVPPGGEATFLAPLPVDIIPCSLEMSRRLALFGLRTLGQLAALPLGALAEQFGPEGVSAARLARGEDQEPLFAGEAPPVLEEGVEMDPPTEEEGRLLAAAGLLLDRLVPRLAEGFLACTLVSLRLSRPDGFEIHLTTTLHEPSTDRTPLERAIARLLGRLGSAPLIGDHPLGDVGKGLVPFRTVDGDHTGRAGARPLPDHDVRQGAAGDEPLPYVIDVGGRSRMALPAEAPGVGAQGPALHRGEGASDGDPPITHDSSLIARLSLCLSGFAPREDEQAELIASRASNLRKVKRTVRRAEEQFGGGAIRPLGEMGGEKPLPRRVGASTDRNGRPAILFLGGRPDGVVEVCNRWRVAGDWWRREIVRDYYRLITRSGRLCLVFQDLTDGSWRLERVYE